MNITHKSPFVGSAAIKVVGLPKGITAQTKEFNKEQQQLTIRLTAAADPPLGEHKSLVCHATVTQNGEPMLHRMYGAQLRINKPLALNKSAAEKSP